MSRNAFFVRKAAVLGSGVMGAQIAAHLANANVEVVLFDLPAKEGDPNGIVHKAIANLQKLEPSPLSVKSKAAYITAANYNDDLELLKGCDFIVEAISERLDWKSDLYKKVSPYISPTAIFATNTSGLSINKLAEGVPANLRSRFCGVHFFNPPRYMTLCELIPTAGTDHRVLDDLETFLTTVLGKGVVRAKDTPNFVANRIGVFSMQATSYHAEKFGLGFDLVDALTGPSIGRAKSATFRTADVVGLDTFAHVVKTMADTLPEDPWHKFYQSPAWMKMLIEKGALGQKTGAGIYRKVGKEIMVLDLGLKDYRPSKSEVAPEVEAILKMKNPSEKFAAMRNSAHPQAQFLWSIFRDVFHYCAVHLQSVANNARDLDLAIRWGFGWNMGPFETWQAAGWQQVTKWISEDIAAGKTMASAPLPAWVTEAGRTGVHSSQGSYSATMGNMQGRSELPVYKRQLYPERVLGESVSYGTTVFETDAVRMWHTGDDVAVLSFKSKMHAIGDDVLDGVLRAVEEAERGFKGLVLWQTEAPFSAGANLAQVMPSVANKDYAAIERTVAKFQKASMALKFSMVPTIAAVYGMALGGGCEFVMHCTKAVAALETYMGLVEGGVGLLPAGGGSKEFAIRAAKEAKGGNFMPFLLAYFQNIAMAQVSRSAEHAKELGYLKASDTIVFHQNEVLHVAKQEALALAESGYRPPMMARDIVVGGKGGIATMQMMLANMKEGGFISEHDYEIGKRMAWVLCGGDVETGSTVTEEWLIDCERKAFMELTKTEKTHARIEFMLKNGKPLRN